MNKVLKWSRARYQPCLPLGEDGKRVTASKEHIELSRKYAAEGMVLLKNDNGTLPLKKGQKIALFGKGQGIAYVKGGGGSGDVITPYVRNFYDGFKIKENEGKISMFEGIAEATDKFIRKTVGASETEPMITLTDKMFLELSGDYVVEDELLNKAKSFTDTAIYIITRYSMESFDRTDFDLFPEEKTMFEKLNSAFENIVVILNIGGAIDINTILSYKNVKSVLLAWQGGIEGGLATADIVCGDVNPSGKLTDTFAKSLDDYPSTATFHESKDYVNYTEDIYVGYRYFETIPGAYDKVLYPFGFGLSYTTFSIDAYKAADDGETVTVECDVTNTGSVAGKEVVQLYYSAPQGKLGKPAKELAAFKKTKELKPGDKEHITMSFKINDMASYDDTGVLCKSAYILEKGDYKLFAGNSVRNVTELDYKYSVSEEYRLVEQLTEKCTPPDFNKRLRADGTYETIPTRPITLYPLVKKEWIHSEIKAPEKPMKLIDVAEGNCTLDEFMAQINNMELAHLPGREEYNTSTGVANTWGIGNMEKFGIPNIMTADGPAGLRVDASGCTGVTTTAWPIETMIACTWDEEAAYKIGEAAALEVKENNIDIWLAPALNIHRSPLCGRNFEYYSEDPLISGKMAAACVKGVQSKGIAATIKHLCCNNKEVNRNNSDSRLSERALREIYLKGFKIAVKESDPWLVMTSYNKMNGIYTSTNYELITDILRGEWGYKGCVTSDWWTGALAIFEVKAGNDIKMPQGFPSSLNEGMNNGTLTRNELESCARRILELILKLGD